ncbi:MAG: AEC family transporter [Clostridia bacterium]|nr:AEC family transporter [Clostridia bacterium]
MMLFLQYMATAFGQVMILAVLVAVGYICDKTGLYTQKVSRACNDLLFYIVTPAVIIQSFFKVEFNPANGLSFLAMFIIIAVFQAVGCLVVWPLYKKSGEDRPVFQYASMYGNMGYMGLPLAEAVAGEAGVFFCSAAVVVFNIFCFSHGISLMQRGKDRLQLKKLLINPGTIGIVVGLPFFLLRLKMPEMIAVPIEYLGSLNTPLAMLMFGTYLANTDLPGMFRKKENYLVAFLKLIALPLVAIGVLYLIGVRGELLVTCAIVCSAPTANNTVMFAAKYDRNTGTASKASGFTSILAIITMPFCIALADLLG